MVISLYCQGHLPWEGKRAAAASIWLLWLSGFYILFESLAAPTESGQSDLATLSPQTLSLEAPARIKNKAPSPDWPQEGEVTFENAEMRYQENLPLVLKKVSFTIKPKEKIGIVGRTGSGKRQQRPLEKHLNLSKCGAHDFLFIEYYSPLFKPAPYE